MSQHEILTETFLIRFSNNYRRKIELRNTLTTVKRKSTLMEQYLFNFVPSAIASAILSPLNRIKILLQVSNQDFIKNNTNSAKAVFDSIINL